MKSKRKILPARAKEQAAMLAGTKKPNPKATFQPKAGKRKKGGK